MANLPVKETELSTGKLVCIARVQYAALNANILGFAVWHVEHTALQRTSLHVQKFMKINYPHP